MPQKTPLNGDLEPEISPKLEAALGDEMVRLRKRVEARARQFALERAIALPAEETPVGEKAPPAPPVLLNDLTLALDETLGKRTVAAPKTSFFDLFPPFTCLCFLLCLIFGGFGMHNAGARDTGFLDIAKIFAGALVGSTTSTAISTIRSQRRSR